MGPFEKTHHQWLPIAVDLSALFIGWKLDNCIPSIQCLCFFMHNFNVALERNHRCQLAPIRSIFLRFEFQPCTDCLDPNTSEFSLR